MTKEREALKLALEALEKSHICPLLPDDCAEAITAMKEALAQPEHGWTPERIAGMARLKDAQDKRLAQPSVSVEQEPVAWVYDPITGSITPPQRTWVGLTDEEERKAFEQWYVCNAFDYERNPIGSRECGLQWSAWKARAAHGIKGEA